MASITVCLLTRRALDAPLVRPPIEPGPEKGLRETSFAMIDKITTVKRERLGQRIGTLTPAAMTSISPAILVSWGSWGRGGR